MKWISLTAERTLYVQRGRDVILCDRNHPGPVELVLGMTAEQVEALRRNLPSPERR